VSSAGEFGTTPGAHQQCYTPTAMRGGAASTSSVDSEDQVDFAKCSPYRNLRNGLQKVNIGGVGNGSTIHANGGPHRHQKSVNGQPPGVGVQTTTSAVSNTQYTLFGLNLLRSVLLLASVPSFMYIHCSSTLFSVINDWLTFSEMVREVSLKHPPKIDFGTNWR
jgi:hypothetical protein